MQLIAKLWVPAALVACATVLAMDPLPFVSPVGEPPPVEASATDATPVRQPSLDPKYKAGVFTYSCNECHGIIPTRQEADRIPVRHDEITLDHGLNTRCFNCHHRTDRNAFVDDFGNTIPWEQPELLCAKCHGPVYRDWQAGSHGRTNGHWDLTAGSQTRRACTNCHDPHVPPFQPMKPAPGPGTLRMGPVLPVEHGGKRNPLHVDGGDHSGGETHH